MPMATTFFAALTTKASRLARGAAAAVLGLGLFVLGNPALGYAQQTMNAQALTAEGTALTVGDLGPEWSVAEHNAYTTQDGWHVSFSRFSSPAGRTVNLTTVLAPSADYAEAVVTYLRYQFETDGLTISSVQNASYGDGRAFKGEATAHGMLSVVYMFRVRNLIAAVNYLGATGAAADVQTQAANVARKQEAKFFNAFAPPTPTPAPTLVPTVVPTPTSAISAAPVESTPVAAVASPAPYCQPGEQPQFRLGFATLSALLGGLMGNPTSCTYADPSGSGDTVQTTDAGLAIYRASSNIVTFTNGSDHWALAGGRAVHWNGDSLDPPDDAEPVGA